MLPGDAGGEQQKKIKRTQSSAVPISFPHRIIFDFHRLIVREEQSSGSFGEKRKVLGSK